MTHAISAFAIGTPYFASMDLFIVVSCHLNWGYCWVDIWLTCCRFLSWTAYKTNKWAKLPRIYRNMFIVFTYAKYSELWQRLWSDWRPHNITYVLCAGDWCTEYRGFWSTVNVIIPPEVGINKNCKNKKLLCVGHRPLHSGARVATNICDFVFVIIFNHSEGFSV